MTTSLPSWVLAPPAGAPASVESLREAGRSLFVDRHFPTKRQEPWRYTNLKALLRPEYHAGGSAEGEWQDAVGAELFPVAGRLVLVDGAYVGAASETGKLPPGVRAGNLSDALSDSDARAADELGSVISPEVSGFVALNTAQVSSGVYIHVSAGVTLEAPLEVVVVTTANTNAAAGTQPRILVSLGDGAGATVVTRFVSAGEGVSLSNTVTECVIGKNAHLRHVKVQDEGRSAFHVDTIGAAVSDHASYRSWVFSLGGHVARTELHAQLNGEGAEAWLDGLYVGNGDQELDHYTLIEHRGKNSVSGELYKGVLSDNSVGTFQGRIVIPPGVTGCSTNQLNRNLILSESAVVNTKPQLEIGNDDVRAAHGATVGQLDKDALMYMRSRGLDEHTAQSLLTSGFAKEVGDRLPDGELRRWVAGLVADRLGLAQALELGI
jgi:Fe-S cluster assembly protein SufD